MKRFSKEILAAIEEHRDLLVNSAYVELNNCTEELASPPLSKADVGPMIDSFLLVFREALTESGHQQWDRHINTVIPQLVLAGMHPSLLLRLSTAWLVHFLSEIQSTLDPAVFVEARPWLASFFGKFWQALIDAAFLTFFDHPKEKGLVRRTPR